MKIYVVTSGEYSDYHIDGVFENYEKAEILCASISDKDYYFNSSPSIEEYDTEEIRIEGKIYRGVRFVVKTYIDFSNNKKKQEIHQVDTFTSLNPIKEEIQKYKNSFGLPNFIFKIPISEKITEEQAQKIAEDRLAKYKAEENGL